MGDKSCKYCLPNDYFEKHPCRQCYGVDQCEDAYSAWACTKPFDEAGWKELQRTFDNSFKKDNIDMFVRVLSEIVMGTAKDPRSRALQVLKDGYPHLSDFLCRVSRDGVVEKFISDLIKQCIDENRKIVGHPCWKESI